MKFVIAENMKFWVIALEFLVMFLGMRLCLSGMGDYMYGEKRARKIRKGQSFADWLLYRRFKDVIPKFFLYSYFFNSILFLLLTFAVIALNLLKVSREILVAVYNYYWYYISVFGVIYIRLFFRPGTRQFDPSRWMGHQKRQCKRKKYKFKGTEK